MVRLHRKGDSRYLRHSRIFTRHRKRRALMRFLRGMLGEHVRVGHGLTVLDDEGVDDLILGVGLAVHDDGVVVEGLQLELGSVEGDAVLRVVAGFGVGLDEPHAAALHIVLGREGVDLAVLAHLHAHLGGSVEVS